MLMSSAHYFDNAAAINPYYHKETVNITQAIAEHETIAGLFKEAGIEIVYTDPPKTSQDGVYTANWALVRGEQAVLARLPNARRSEEAVAKLTLADLGYRVIEVPDNLRFSGQGDALPFGNLLFCGQGYRSDLAAQQFAAETLGFERIQLQTVAEIGPDGQPVINRVSGWPDSFFYDIDLALSIIKPPQSDGSGGLIAYCPEAFMPESQLLLEGLAGIDKIAVSLEEATQGFACNLVSTGETVIMSGHAPQLKAELEQRGLRVVTPDVKELIKGGGFIRCVSLTLQ